MLRKSLIMLAVCLLFIATPVYAGLFEDNSNTNQQGQGQGQIGINENENTNQQGQIGINDQDQGQQQGQGIFGSGNSDNVNRNNNNNDNRAFGGDANQGQGQGQDQGQLQGQGQGQGQDQGQVATGGDSDQGQGQGQIMGQGQDIKIDDHSEYKQKIYHLVSPNTVAGSGQQAASAYSILGGVNWASTEEAKNCMDVLNVIGKMKEAGWLTKEEAQAEALAVFRQLKDATASRRLFGILWKTTGCHAGNAFGAASWDDLWAKMVQRKPVMVKEATVDTNLTVGNRGVITSEDVDE